MACLVESMAAMRDEVVSFASSCSFSNSATSSRNILHSCVVALLLACPEMTRKLKNLKF